MNNSIEERIKDIIKNKLKDDDEMDEKTKEQISKFFDKIDLKNESKTNTKLVEQNTAINVNTNEIVLDEITHNDTVYYKDKHNGVWNENAELVGVYNKGQVILFGPNISEDLDPIDDI